MLRRRCARRRRSRRARHRRRCRRRRRRRPWQSARPPQKASREDAMGHKINPIGFRLAFNRSWASRWFAQGSGFAAMLNEDLKVRAYLKRRLGHAMVSKVLIERPAKDARITIHSARPGVVIGKKGEDIEMLKADLRKLLGVNAVHVNIEEVRKPEVGAQLSADPLAQQLEKRILF